MIDEMKKLLLVAWRVWVALFVVAISSGSAINCGSALNSSAAPVTIQLDGWSVRVVPSTLAIYGTDLKTGRGFEVSHPTTENQEVRGLSFSGQSLNWQSASGLGVRIVSDG